MPPGSSARRRVPGHGALRWIRHAHPAGSPARRIQAAPGCRRRTAWPDRGIAGPAGSVTGPACAASGPVL